MVQNNADFYYGVVLLEYWSTVLLSSVSTRTLASAIEHLDAMEHSRVQVTPDGVLCRFHCNTLPVDVVHLDVVHLDVVQCHRADWRQ